MRTPPARDVSGGADERPPARRPASEPPREGEALVEHLVDRVARAEHDLRVTQGLVARADAERALLARAARMLAVHDVAPIAELARLGLPLLGEWCIIESVVAGIASRAVVADDRGREVACAALGRSAPVVQRRA